MNAHRAVRRRLSVLFLHLHNALKHISPCSYSAQSEREGERACVQMNQCCLLYCFRLKLFRVSYLREQQIMFSKLALIISDPGERKALSLRTIKDMELP